jgi:hypothetical protein
MLSKTRGGFNETALSPLAMSDRGSENSKSRNENETENLKEVANIEFP